MDKVLAGAIDFGKFVLGQIVGLLVCLLTGLFLFLLCIACGVVCFLAPGYGKKLAVKLEKASAEEDEE